MKTELQQERQSELWTPVIAMASRMTEPAPDTQLEPENSETEMKELTPEQWSEHKTVGTTMESRMTEPVPETQLEQASLAKELTPEKWSEH